MSATPTFEQVTYSVDDPIATIALNRPDNLNALTGQMLSELRGAMAEAEKDDNVVGILLTGEGRGFCAGADMQGLKATSEGGGASSFREEAPAQPGAIDEMGAENFGVTYTYLMAVRKPIVVAVNGACAGLGFSIAMLCDMRFASDRAVFTTAFANRGLIAEHGLSWILPRTLGPAGALDLLWSGRKIDANEAEKMGVVNRVVPHDNLLDEARSYLTMLAERSSPTSLMIMKQQVYRHMNMPIGDAMRESNDLMAESLTRGDFKEGVSSFLERRPPQFARISVD